MGKMTINGVTYEGNNISICNNGVIIDGKVQGDSLSKDVIEIKGDVQSVSCDKSLTIIGSIKGNADARGSINCDKIGGDVNAGGSVNCDDVGGNVSAGGSVNCDDVAGRIL